MCSPTCLIAQLLLLFVCEWSNQRTHCSDSGFKRKSGYFNEL